MNELERRVLPSEFEFRSAGENKVTIFGYAYKFRLKSQNLGGFREQVLEGAGEESAQADDIRALVNHEASMILGRSLSGTLRLGEDSTGLEYEIDADERQSYVRNLIIALERKDVTQSSFGFQALDDDWSLDEDDFPLRSVRKMKLFDVSPVTYPAYLSSEAQVSSRCLDMATALAEPRGLWTPDEIDLHADAAMRLRMKALTLRG